MRLDRAYGAMHARTDGHGAKRYHSVDTIGGIPATPELFLINECAHCAANHLSGQEED